MSYISNIKAKFLFFYLLIYSIISIFFRFININFYLVIINPLLCLIIDIYILLYQKQKLYSKTNYKDYFITITTTIIFIIINFLLGFKLGFVINPLCHNYIIAFKNIFIHIIPIISLELIRNIILNQNRHNKLVPILVTIFIILIEINTNQLLPTYNNKEFIFQYLCSTIIPIVSSNILYTYISLNISYKISLILILVNIISVILLPIFPNINWFTKGTLSLLKFFVIYFLFKNKLAKESLTLPPNKNSFVLISYALTLIFATSLVCFMLGIFKYKPITILSNSMTPVLNRGDIVIYKKLNIDELNNLPLNSIIIFSYNDKYIIHRIISKREEDHMVYYTTKGDNNETADYNEISASQIQGLYIFHIKYLGYPSIWLNNFFNT